MCALVANDWLCGRQRVPVLLNVERAVAFECQHMTGRKLLDVAKERRRRGRRQKSQVVIERLLVDVRSDGGVLQNGFDLGGEDEAAVALIKVKRFDADAIAHEHELLFGSVPQRDRVITFDVVNEIEAAFFVKVNNRFGIRARSVFVAVRFEADAEFCVVVDLAVEDEPGVLVAAVHRLMTGGGEIDDRQTAKPEAAAMIIKKQVARVVRAAMRHLVAHSRDERSVDRSFARAVFPDSTDAAHFTCYSDRTFTCSDRSSSSVCSPDPTRASTPTGTRAVHRNHTRRVASATPATDQDSTTPLSKQPPRDDPAFDPGLRSPFL